MARFKSQWNAIEIQQRVDEEPCTHQQGRRDCNLANHEGLIEPEPLMAGGGAPRFPDPGMRRNPRRLPGRCESEENAGSEGDSQSEQKYAPVELCLHQFQLRRIRQQPKNNVAAEIAEEQTRRSPKAGKQQALGEHWPVDTYAVSPQRH